MKNSLKYFVISVEENKEVYLKHKIDSIFPELHIVIPIKKIRFKSGEKTFLSYDRVLPDYLLVGFEDTISDSTVSKISSIKGVLSVLDEKVEVNGKSVSRPSILPKEESDKLMMSELKKEEVDSIDGEVWINQGQYFGYSGTIKKKLGDEFLVNINIKTKPKAKIPIWFLSKEIA